MKLRRVGIVIVVAACVAAVFATAAGAATTEDVVGQAAPTLVPHSKLPGAGAFEGPVYTLPVDGVKLGYRQFGRGPDLIMVQGDTAPMSLWLPYLLHPLARHFTVTIFDNRGVGYSTDDFSRPLTVPLMARDTAGLIEALGLYKPTLVGWSMGGEIGLTLAEQEPEMLSALVTTGGDAGSSHTVPPPPGLIRKLANPKASTNVFLELLFPSTAAGGAATARFVRSYEQVPQEKVSTRTLRRQEAAEEAFLRYPGTWRGLPAIKAPTLITNGALDPGVPPINARRLHARIPGSTLSIYAGRRPRDALPGRRTLRRPDHRLQPEGVSSRRSWLTAAGHPTSTSLISRRCRVGPAKGRSTRRRRLRRAQELVGIEAEAGDAVVGKAFVEGHRAVAG